MNLIGFLVVLTLVSGCATVGAGAVDSKALAQKQALDGALLPEAPSEPDAQQASFTEELLYQLLVADLAAKRGQTGLAIENYLDAARTTGDPRLAEQATRLAFYARDTRKALEAATLWVDSAPDDVAARQTIGTLLIRDGQLERAFEHLETLVAGSDDGTDSGFLFVAGMLGREEDKQAALEVMERLIDRHRDEAEALYAYSTLAVRAGELDKALTAVDHVLALKPGWHNAEVLRANILRMQDRPEDALAYLKGLVEQRPQDGGIRVAYARMLVNLEQHQAAYDQFQEAVKLLPQNQDIIFALGVLSLRLGDLDQAEEYLISLNHIGARREQTSYYLGQIAETKQDDEAAIDWYSTVTQGENYLDAQIRIAVLLAKAGDITTARERLQRMRVSNGVHNLRLYLTEGEILRAAGQMDEAVAVFSAALEEIPGNIGLLYSRAMTYERLDALAAMEQDLHNILGREPDNVDALNALGYTLADRTTRYEEALNYIQRALELRPQDYAIMDSMGWVQYRLGRLQEAVKYLTRAFEMSPDSEIAAHLGEVLWVMGDHQGAKDVWNRALEVAPESEILHDVMRRLDH